MSLEIALKRIREAKENNATELNLSDLGLTEIPTEIRALTNLRELYLSNNQISEISGLDALSNLTKLNLARNQIREIKGIKTLVNLRLFTFG